MKKIVMVIGAVLVLSFVGFGFYQLNATSSSPKLSAEEIKTMVASQYPGEVTKLELKKDQNNAVYELEIVGDGKEYDVTLDGNSGEVLYLTEKDILGKKDNSQTDNTQNGKQEVTRTEGKPLSDKQQQKRQRDRDGEFIGICKAAEIADQQHAGMLEEVELEYDNGTYYYEAKMRNDHQKVKYKIDAQNGELMKTKTEQKNNKSSTVEQAKKQGKAMISFCQAKEIATEEHPGSVVEIELETEDGKLVYDVTIYDDDSKVSVEIDALTGEIIVIEIDD